MLHDRRRIQRHNTDGSSTSVREEDASKPPSQRLREEKQKQTARREVDNDGAYEEDPACDEKCNEVVENINASDYRLTRFLDSLVVASVSLDESAIFKPPAPSENGDASEQVSCVTCDGDVCPISPHLRKAVKEKAVSAMKEDGVDISTFRPKNIHDVLPLLIDHFRQRKDVESGSSSSRWKRVFSLMRDFLEETSREMAMGYAGVARAEDTGGTNVVLDLGSGTEEQVVDQLIVLCACSDEMKRPLSDVSKKTLEWNIDAPTSAAKAGEGDGAYLRVSRQIRRNVEDFMDRLKKAAVEDLDLGT